MYYNWTQQLYTQGNYGGGPRDTDNQLRTLSVFHKYCLLLLRDPLAFLQNSDQNMPPVIFPFSPEPVNMQDEWQFSGSFAALKLGYKKVKPYNEH